MKYFIKMCNKRGMLWTSNLYDRFFLLFTYHIPQLFNIHQSSDWEAFLRIFNYIIYVDNELNTLTYWTVHTWQKSLEEQLTSYVYKKKKSILYTFRFQMTFTFF